MGPIGILLIAAVVAAGPSPCKPQRLSREAAILLKPVLSESFAAHAEEFDAQGRYRTPSPRAAVFEERFYKLLAIKSEAANEAIAALMAFYVGEHAGEELMCEAFKRGRAIAPYLRRFVTCVPITCLEPIDPFFTRIPNERAAALKQIAAGANPCEE